MLDAAVKAVSFTAHRQPEDLDRDEMLLLALLRLLEVIGEAATGVSERFKADHADLPWRQMTATRNRLIHGYFDVDPTIVWNIVTKNLPDLVAKLEKLIPEL
ncbi:MAG: HepT-like ribonuclease domain-containing protein [bacterium]